MTDILRARHERPSWNRVVATLLILTAFFSPPIAGSRAVLAAPAALAQNLCTLMPPGYDPAVVTDMDDYCYVVYNQPDGAMINLELSRMYSPAEAHRHLPCDPASCSAGLTCNSLTCSEVFLGDWGPVSDGASHQGVTYAPTSLGGTAYAWTRGCYLLVGSTLWSTSDVTAALWDLMLRADPLIATGTCAGCSDPSVCQEQGTGGGTGTGLTLAAPNCYYSTVQDWLSCVAQVVEAPAGARLLYEWSLDGTLQGETTESFEKWISPDGQAHTIQVMARDPDSGKTSAPTSYNFQAAAGGGSLQVQTASGTTSIGGSNPTSTTSLVLTGDDPLAKLMADCPLIGLVLLAELGFDGAAAGGGSARTPLAVTIAVLAVECARFMAEGPLQIASVGDPALFLPAQAAGDDLPMQLGIGLQGGPLRVNASSDQVQLDVQTPAASVRSAGQNDFGVNADVETGDTTVVVYGGTVEVYSSSTGAPIASLQAGQQVEVTADGVRVGESGEAGSGEPEGTGATGVGPYGEGVSQPEGASDSEPGKSPVCSLLGVIVPFVAVALARRRK